MQKKSKKRINLSLKNVLGKDYCMNLTHSVNVDFLNLDV